MGRKCVVPNCRSGYDETTKGVCFFGIPKHKLEAYQRAIPRQDRQLTPKDAICAKHFQDEDIIYTVETACYSYDLKFPRLAEDAIPSIFPGCPKYLSRPISKKRRIIQKYDLKERPKSKKSKVDVEVENDCVPNEINLTQEIPTTDVSDQFDCMRRLFNLIWEENYNLTLPSKSWAVHLTTKGINFKTRQICIGNTVLYDGNILFNKKVVLTQNSIETTAFDHPVSFDEYVSKIDTIEKLESFVNFFENIRVCCGGNKHITSDFQNKSYKLDHSLRVWRHTKCPYIIDSGDKCSFCRKSRKAIYDFERKKSAKNVISKLRVKLRKYNNRNRRLRIKNKHILTKLNTMKQQMNEIDEEKETLTIL